VNGRQAAGKVGAWAAAVLCASPALAGGTPAGTDIVNTAQLSWVDGSTPRSVDSNPASFKVDERIDVAIAALDSGSIPVAPGDQGRVLGFRVVNAGNALEAFALAGQSGLSGSQWTPDITSLVIDSNGNGEYDPGVDQPYRAGINDPALAADASVTIFVVANVPGGLADGSVGLAALRATAVTGSGAPGTVFVGKGADGTDAVIGATTATAATQGSLIASLAVPQLAKTQQITDPTGGNSAVPGAIITYTLSATYAGAVPNTGGVIEDPIPAGTSYVPGSLTINGAPLTDIADGDTGQATSSAIRVAVPTLSQATKAVVTFQVRVNN